MLLLFEVHKSSSIVQVTKVVLSGHVETQTIQTADCADRADCEDCADWVLFFYLYLNFLVKFLL